MITSDEAFQPPSAWGSATRSHDLWVGTFYNMEEETRGGVRDWFSGRAWIIFQHGFLVEQGKFSLEHG